MRIPHNVHRRTTPPGRGVPAASYLAMISPIVVIAVIALTAGWPSASQAQEFSESFRFGEDHLCLVNMIGAISIEPTSGSEFEVEVTVRGDDAKPGLLEFDADRGRNSELVILFPLEDERTYVYPRLGRWSNSSFRYPRRPAEDRSWADRLGLGKDGPKVKVKGSGRGLEVWADVTVRVPRDGELRVRHGVGSIRAEKIRGSCTFDLNSGDVDVRHVDGDLVINTGSGDVAVAEVRGDLHVDTGSGDVAVAEVRGDLHVDTGSGDVRAANVSAESVLIDTGSGSVRLELDRMGNGDFEIDTGSGGIELRLADDASVHVRASTGSGEIDVNLDGTRIRNSEDDVSFKVGGANANVRLDTGSGGIRIWQ